MLQLLNKKRGMSAKGQTLIVTLLVMFVLAIVAAAFIALVSSNLLRSRAVSIVDVVGQIAQSGIDYANTMLTAGEEGADYRPRPDNNGVSNVPNPDPGATVAPVPATDWEYQRDNYPDFEWTRAYWPTEYFPSGYTPGSGEIGCAGPTGGYTTFKTGQGRFLLRISYNLDPDDPLSKYIRIDSIGRWGQGIETLPSGEVDPTTLKGASDRVRKELTAYKPIGITDSVRFITNMDNRSIEFPLGTPGFTTVYGRASDSNYGWRSGSIMVNGTAKIFGIANSAHTADDASVFVYMRGEQRSDGTIMPIDKFLVAGDLVFDDDRTAATDPVTQAWIQIITGGGALIGGPVELGASNPRYGTDTPFTTAGGFFRDASGGTDAALQPRNVKRVDPPIIDQADLTNTTLRYRLLTLNSGEQYHATSGWVNLGKYGYGRGVYIDNFSDVQDESETLFGGYTLRSDWLNPNNLMSPYWKGPFYIPPGVSIRLNPVDTDGDGQPDFTITRTDGQTWYDASGNPRPDWGATIRMPYPDPKNGRVLTSVIGGTGRRVSGNGVIYAEGNIRVRGMLPKKMQLTIVSNENIYIEGNVLKNRPIDTNGHSIPIGQTDPWRGADESCGLALLARKNVVVNTTAFFAPVDSVSPDQIGSDAQNGEPPYHVIVNNDPDSRFRLAFEFGPFESDTWWQSTPAPTADPDAYQLLLRHGGQFGAAYINAWLNPGTNEVPGFGMLSLNIAPYPIEVANGLPPYVWGVGDEAFNPAGWGLDSAFAGNMFDITPATANQINSSLNPTPGYPNMFQVSLDHSYFTRANYLLGGMAVQPMDIRIEAVIYAQEGSFFVIPGAWFNPNPSDGRPDNDSDRRTATRPDGVNGEFPFFGDALDIRVLIDGAVSENMPASVSDAGAWMEKWGRIPPTYGSSGKPTAHPNEGLTFLYDDHAGWPLTNLRSGGTRIPIRTDGFGRALPLAPRLPVSRTLIYSGDLR